MRTIIKTIRQAILRTIDLRRRRREQRRHQGLLRLLSEHDIPQFLLPPDPQLPPRPTLTQEAALKSYPAGIIAMPNGHLVSNPAYRESTDDEVE